MRTPFLIAALTALFASCASEPQPAIRVLLITTDTVRADALQCYGLPLPAATTETLDRIASEGTLYLRAACNIPATLTSHTSILSGRLPRSTGVRFAKDQVPGEVETLAETLKMEGFSTAAFLSAVVLNKTYGLDQGFDVYEDLSHETFIDAERSAEDTNALALDWLMKRKADEPFFMWVHYYDPHSPYHPDEEFDTYGPEGYDGMVNGSADQVSQFVANKGADLSEADLARLRALYLGEVEYMDRHIGTLIDAFDQYNSDGRSIVAVLADHGENLGEGGRFFHGPDLHGQSMHIPFMIRWPHGMHEGTSERRLVQGIDVMPTILNACDVAVPLEVEGVDLAQWFEPGASAESRIALQENEDEYRSDADKIYGAEGFEGRLIDRRFTRREPVLVGRSLGIELKQSCFLQAWVKGDDTIELAAHIRYHTAETLQAGNPVLSREQPSIMVRTNRYGLEAIHQIHDLPELSDSDSAWTPVASPDLFDRARSYGETQGWPVDHIQIESLVIDVGGVPGQQRVDAYVDQVELVGKQAMLLDDFDSETSIPYQDAGVGPEHVAGSRIEAEEGLNESGALHVVAQYEDAVRNWTRSELYLFSNPMRPYDEINRFSQFNPSSPDPMLESLANAIEEWIEKPPAKPSVPSEIDPAQDEKLRSLGYF